MNPSIMSKWGGMCPFKENKPPSKQSGECNNLLCGFGCVGHRRNSVKGSEGSGSTVLQAGPNHVHMISG